MKHFQTHHITGKQSFLEKIKALAYKSDGKLDFKQIAIWIGLGIAGLFLSGIVLLVLTIAIFSIGLPDVHDLDKLSVAQSTTIYDREGHALYVSHGGENRQYVAYEQISPQLVDATVAIEDSKYWEHSGFNPTGILRAVITNISHGSAEQGGSTITQQYIKKTFLSDEKSIIRKIKELILSVQLERSFDKKKIIELYLNKIPYGNNAFGIEKAAQIYFNKSAKDLNLAESAILASIPNAPTSYNPQGRRPYTKLTKEFTEKDLFFRNIKSEEDLRPDEYILGLLGTNITVGSNTFFVQGRSDLVLKRMEQLGYITAEQKKSAQDEIQKMQFKKYQEKMQFPHFVSYVLDLLEQKYGKEVLEQGGLSVYTTVDPRMQEIAETTLKDGTVENEKKFNVKNAALVSIDPTNGQIMAMVGSHDFYDPIDGKENVALNYRQPGSSFKPLVYAQAFYNQLAPGTIIFDAPTRLGTDTPKNFDGSFRGPMTVRAALGQSRNIPAIKAYFIGGGTNAIINLVKQMGITINPKQNPDDLSYTFAIGAGEVRLLDMVTAFSAFANTGIQHPTTAFLKIQNAKGDILEEWKDEPGKEVIDPQVAFLINSILSDTSVRLSQNLTIPGQVNAAKTGTSDIKDKGKYYPHDLWTMGYTTKLVTGVWAGNNRDARDGHLSYAADGTNVAAPMWKKFMTAALKNTPSAPFPIPDGVKSVAISKVSGKLPGPNTPSDQIHNDFFASFSIPTEIDDSFTTVEIDASCGMLANEFTPEEMKKRISYINIHDAANMFDWEQSARSWLQSKSGVINTNSPSAAYGQPPTETCAERNQENFENRPVVIITGPIENTAFVSEQKFMITTSISSKNEIDRVDFYLDDNLKYTTTTAPYDAELKIPYGDIPGTEHTITVKAFDKLGFLGTGSIKIKVGSP